MMPWEDPSAPEHVKIRQPVMEIHHARGVRSDLPRRRDAECLAPSLSEMNFGIVIMTHRGCSNGRLSMLLSSIPENYKVVVSSDSISELDIRDDAAICEAQGAIFKHSSPWGGRIGNAIHCMQCQDFDPVLFLNDDIWMMPGAISEALRWWTVIKNHVHPGLASLGFPIWSTYENWGRLGFKSWEDVIERPWILDSAPPHPDYLRAPALYKNPFGACMMMDRKAYLDLGGFNPNYWAQDDVYSHMVWTSDRYYSAVFPSRGFAHIGAQSWHHGESVEYVREFFDATGMTAEQSGALQVAAMLKWMDRIGPLFVRLGGQAGI